MSQHHKPPRQNVHRLRKPVTTPKPKQFRSGKSAVHKKQGAMDNAAFNAHAQRANAPGAVASAGQVVAATKTN